MTTQETTEPSSPNLPPYIDLNCNAITVRRGRPERCGYTATDDGRCAEHAQRLKDIGV